MTAGALANRALAIELAAAIEVSSRGSGVAARVFDLVCRGADPYAPIVPPEGGQVPSPCALLFGKLAKSEGESTQRWLAAIEAISRAAPRRAPPFGHAFLQPAGMIAKEVSQLHAWTRASGIERLARHLDTNSPEVAAMRDDVIRASHVGLGPLSRPTNWFVTLEEAVASGTGMFTPRELLCLWQTPVTRSEPIGATRGQWLEDGHPGHAVFEEVRAFSTGALPHLLRLVARGSLQPEFEMAFMRSARAALAALPRRLALAGVDLNDPASVGLKVHSPLHVAIALGNPWIAADLMRAGADPDARGAAACTPAQIAGDQPELGEVISQVRAARARTLLRSRVRPSEAPGLAGTGGTP